MTGVYRSIEHISVMSLWDLMRGLISSRSLRHGDRDPAKAACTVEGSDFHDCLE